MRPSYSFKLRTTSFILAIVFVVSVFCADLFRIQIIDKEKYASKKLTLSQSTSKIQAVRGG